MNYFCTLKNTTYAIAKHYPIQVLHLSSPTLKSFITSVISIILNILVILRGLVPISIQQCVQLMLEQSPTETIIYILFFQKLCALTWLRKI